MIFKMKSLPVGLTVNMTLNGPKTVGFKKEKKNKNTKIVFMVKWISRGVAGSHEGKPRQN